MTTLSGSGRLCTNSAKTSRRLVWWSQLDVGERLSRPCSWWLQVLSWLAIVVLVVSSFRHARAGVVLRGLGKVAIVWGLLLLMLLLRVLLLIPSRLWLLEVRCWRLLALRLLVVVVWWCRHVLVGGEVGMVRLARLCRACGHVPRHM